MLKAGTRRYGGIVHTEAKLGNNSYNLQRLNVYVNLSFLECFHVFFTTYSIKWLTHTVNETTSNANQWLIESDWLRVRVSSIRLVLYNETSQFSGNFLLTTILLVRRKIVVRSSKK